MSPNVDVSVPLWVIQCLSNPLACLGALGIHIDRCIKKIVEKTLRLYSSVEQAPSHWLWYSMEKDDSACFKEEVTNVKLIGDRLVPRETFSFSPKWGNKCIYPYAPLLIWSISSGRMRQIFCVHFQLYSGVKSTFTQVLQSEMICYNQHTNYTMVVCYIVYNNKGR